MNENQLAEAREQFLCAETVDADAVRDTILASWWRSRTWNVAADHIELPYIKDPNLDTPLTQCAAPILQRLRDELSDLAVSIILTDDCGVVLDRRTDDGDLQRYLDKVLLAPGYSYAEQFVGTNGIGTALEGLQPAAVFGHEHYAEYLDTLACAGVPIRHPISGQVIGLIDLTCWRKEASPLLMTLAKTTARNIEKELTTQVGLRELSLFTEYLRACRRGHGIVLALNNDLVMTNEDTRHSLAPQDQAALVSRAAEVLTARKHLTVTVDLPSGSQARMSCSPVTSTSGPAGGVVRVRLTREAELPRPSLQDHHPKLPGLVGSGALWLRACQEVLSHREKGEWLTVEGEAGVGKIALVQAVHARTTPGAPLSVIDFAEHDDPGTWSDRLRRYLDDSSRTIVLRHLDQLTAESQSVLAQALSLAALKGTADNLPWVIATTLDTASGGISADVLQHFSYSVVVPPLRHHIEDIRDLVPFLLLRLNKGTPLTCAPATIQLLLRTKWPGNVSQLRRVLQKVVQRRRSGTVIPEDLPPECRTTSRRVLTPLESMERDAIVRCLLDAEGKKTQAAKALGMSRATIYRKIREYGIEVS